MSDAALRIIASTWAHGPGKTASNAKLLARLKAASKEYRNIIGNAPSMRNERERKARIQRILRRRAYLIRKMNRGRPLDPEERAFLSFFNIGRWRGEAYTRGLARKPLSRQPGGMRYSEDPLGPFYGTRMYRMTRTNLPGGPNPLYGTGPLNMSPTNRYRTTGKRTGTVASFRRGSSMRPVNVRWRRAIEKALSTRRRRSAA